MKYLLLDTNIYVDMIITRDKAHNPHLFENFLKLLNSDKIKLIVPSVIKTETFRHINDEINNIGIDVKNLSSNIKNLHWINKAEELDKFNKDLSKLKDGVKSLRTEFDKNSDSYEKHYKSLFDKIFTNKNSITVNENMDIILKAKQREIHKKRPYHYRENKDSVADAIIAETLINIGDIIKLDKDDIIYFVSKNKKDFSEEKNENILHKDIMNDIKEKSVFKNIEYRLNLSATLFREFKKELDELGIAEELKRQYEEEMRELKKQLEEEQKALEEEHYYELLDYEREMCGLSSLKNAEDYEEILSEDPEISELIDNICEIKENLSIKADEFYWKYDELVESIRKKSIDELKSILKNNPLFNILLDIDIDADNFDDVTYDILFSFKEAIGDEEYVKFIEDFDCIDYFSLDDTLLSFSDSEDNKYVMQVDGILSPENGGIDNIYINIRKNSNVISKATIEINYGYGEINDDGNVGNGCEESIEIYNVDEVHDKLVNIIEEVINDINNKIDKMDKIISIINN